MVIRGLGLVQQFRNQGIRLNNSTGATVSGVTMSTNCFSGIILIGGSGHLLENNVAKKWILSMANYQIGLNAVVFEVLIPLPGCVTSLSCSFI